MPFLGCVFVCDSGGAEGCSNWRMWFDGLLQGPQWPLLDWSTSWTVNFIYLLIYLFILGRGVLKIIILERDSGVKHIIRYILEFIRHLPSVDCRNCYLLHLLWVSVKSLCGLRIREKWNYNKWLTLVWL